MPHLGIASPRLQGDSLETTGGRMMWVMLKQFFAALFLFFLKKTLHLRRLFNEMANMRTLTNYGFAGQSLMSQIINKPHTYNTLHKQRMEQKRLISEGKITKQNMHVGFSAKGQAAFDRGVTLNDILKKYNTFVIDDKNYILHYIE